ncbi:hypothetical protein NDU88_008012, partial [Pleurodeles waltl]
HTLVYGPSTGSATHWFMVLARGQPHTGLRSKHGVSHTLVYGPSTGSATHWFTVLAQGQPHTGLR